MLPYLRIETLKNHTLSDGAYSISPPPHHLPPKEFVFTQAYKVLLIERRKRYWWHDSWVQTIYSEHISYENYKFTFRCKNSGELGAAKFGNKSPFGGFTKTQLENNRQTLYQSHYICELTLA